VTVVGTDGHLWARTSGVDGWSWVDHGAPAGRKIKTAVPPLAIDAPMGPPTTHVLADDGRLWMLSLRADEGRWVDRAAPQGHLITAIIGAVILRTPQGRVPAAAAVSSNGYVWVNTSTGGVFEWTDLGTPNPQEPISTGIEIQPVVGPTGLQGSAQDILVLGLSGQVWRLRWTPGTTGRWMSLGRPGDGRIRGRVGTMPDPANRGAYLVGVVAHDKEVWVCDANGPVWTRWDRTTATTTVVPATAVAMLPGVPCVMLLDDANRVQLVTPRLPSHE